MKRDGLFRMSALLGATVMLLASTATGWSQSLTWLGTLGGTHSAALGVSADGRVVVGWAFNAAGDKRAFCWEFSRMEDLGTLGGRWSGAWGVSADGRVVVGWANNATLQSRAFRWESGVMQDLGTLPGDVGSYASGVSADGRVVVGGSRNAAGVWRAFRWEFSRMASARWAAIGARLMTSARWAAIGARLMASLPTGAWWSAGLSTP
jgi:probable HAF family extracellular repeat protein